jgi:hypothetical protein
MNAVSKLSRVVCVSPWLLLVFTIIPLLFILSVTAHIHLPLVSVTSMLVNNACFALLVAVRFLWYCAGLRLQIRYGDCCGKPRRESIIPLSRAEAQGTLVKGGFSFNPAGAYGEKPDHGYLGTTLLYGGLLLVLVFGTLDNLRQFSGTILDSVGPVTKLSRAEVYQSIIKGPFAAKIDTLPQMKILDQLMPTPEYPRGATEIALLFADGAALKKTITPMEPFKFGDYDIIMAKFVIEPQITIKTRDSKTVFNGLVRLNPEVRKADAYGFSGQFRVPDGEGLAYYQSDSKTLRVLLKQGGTWVFKGAMTFQVDQQVTQGDYTLSCEKMGKWTEIHVVRRRHLKILVAGGIVMLFGLLLRITIRPQRVWLEVIAGGTRVRWIGKDTERRLKVEG